MADVELKVRIGAEFAEIKSALRALSGDLGKLNQTIATQSKTAAAGTNKLTESLGAAKRAVVGLVTAYASFASVASVARLSDEYKQFQAQLRLVAKSQEELAFAQEATFAIAQRNQQGLAQTANLYARLARATSDLGATQGQVAQATDAIAQAIRVSGVSSQEAEAAITQLGQGLASGALRGDELRSVLEQTPRLAKAIADGLGTSVGQLRQLGEDGELTAEKVFGAILSQQDKLKAEAAQLPRTIGGAFTVLRNSAVQLVGDLDAATGASSGLASMVEGLGAYLASGQLQASFIQTFGTWGPALSAIGDEVRALLNRLGDLSGGAASLSDFLGRAFRELPTNVRAFIQIAVVETLAFFDKLAAYAAGFKDRIKAIFTDDTQAAVTERVEAEIKAIEEARTSSIEAILGERDAHIQAGIAARQRYETERAARQAAAGIVAGQPAGTLKPSGPTAAELKEMERLRKQQAADAKRAAEEAEQIERRHLDTLLDMRIQAMKDAGQLDEARRLELEAEYDDLLTWLKAKGDDAGIAFVQGFINKSIARARFDELKAEFDAKLEEMRAAEQSVEARAETGELTPMQAEEEIQRIREGSITQLQQLVALTQQLAAEIGDPAIVASVQAMGQALANSTAQLSKMQAEVRDSAAGSIEGFLTDLATGAKSFGEAIRAAAQQFVQSLIRMAAEALAKKAALQLFGPSGTFAGLFHSGGIVGAGGIRRKVPALAFAGAPRYHSGGIAGLGPNEVPAVLKKGEEVLTRGDPRHAANGGGGQGVRIVNVIDPAMAGDYLSSAAGEKVVMNLLQRNKNGIKQILA